MPKNVDRQTEPQPISTGALSQRLVEVVNLVRDGKNCIQLRKLLKNKLYTDGKPAKAGTKRWHKTRSRKHTVTHKTTVLALIKPIDEGNMSGLWRAFDLNEKRLGIRDEIKNPLIRKTRKRVMETPYGNALVRIVVLIKAAKEPKKLNEDVLKVMASYPETTKLIFQLKA